MIINSNFEGGNIDIISAQKQDDIKLAIRKDIHANFSQRFYFHLLGDKNPDSNFGWSAQHSMQLGDNLVNMHSIFLPLLP